MPERVKIKLYSHEYIIYLKSPNLQYLGIAQNFRVEGSNFGSWYYGQDIILRKKHVTNQTMVIAKSLKNSITK